MPEKDHRKAVFFFLALAGAAALILPLFDYLPFIRLGDHGRDLYAHWRTSLGEAPYRGYYWPYGPLMPYLYAICMKLGGVSALSVMAGAAVLKAAGALFVYAALALFIQPPLACLGALWFAAFNLDFFHTWNHAGGVTAILASLYFTLRCLDGARTRDLACLSAALLFAFLVKFNVGAASLGAAALSLFLSGETKRSGRRIAAGFAGTALAAVAAYAALLAGLPSYYVAQCLLLPFPGSNVYIFAPLAQLKALASYLFLSPLRIVTENAYLAKWLPAAAGIVFAASAVLAAAIDRSLVRQEGTARRLKPALAAAFIFSLAGLHEFFFNRVNYKLYWAVGPFIVLLFLAAGAGLPKLKRALRLPILGLVTLMIAMHGALDFYFSSKLRENESRRLAGPRMRCGTGMPEEWIAAVRATAGYLQENLRPGETFLALPFEPFYYYITERKNPLRENMFCDSLGIAEEQERAAIAELERQKVRFVVVSGSVRPDSSLELGRFGGTYGRLLKPYLEEKFKAVKSFGDVSRPDDLVGAHSTTVYERTA